MQAATDAGLDLFGIQETEGISKLDDLTIEVRNERRAGRVVKRERLRRFKWIGREPGILLFLFFDFLEDKVPLALSTLPWIPVG